MSSQVPARPAATAWVVALVALPLVTALACIPFKREPVALAVLPPVDARIPPELLGAAWLIVPLCVLVLLLVTVRRDRAPRPPARAVALVAAASLGTVTYVMGPSASGTRFVDRTFGAAAGRADAVGDGILLGLVGVLGAAALTVLVLLLAFRRPAGLDEWTEERRRERSQQVGRRLGVVLLASLVVALGAIAVAVT